MADRQGLTYLWRTAERAPGDLFAALPDLPPVVVQVLHARGLRAPDDCLDFLAGHCRDADDPTLLADLPRAVERLVLARDRQENVVVFTDYDADGVNAAAILATGLRMVGIQPRVYLPNRFLDGYGLTEAIVGKLADEGAQVIVTADCGSTAHEAARLARQRGVDLVVTDHHTCPPELPEVLALINPKRLDCSYPCEHLCGAGVAYKLLQALADATLPDGRAAMDPLLDLVALATVADVMPLQGENRQLVLRGLKIMNVAPRPGIRALIEAAGLAAGEVDAGALGFRLAPRINAAGRLDDPSIAYRLLMADTYAEAHALVEEIDGLNTERQALTRAYQEQALGLVRSHVERGGFGIVCGGADWPQGIVGLVAGRLAQTYHRPALVYTVRDGVATGSGRSIDGLDLLAVLRQCDDLFSRYGGHRAAAGFTLPEERIGALVERFEGAAAQQLQGLDLRPALQLDAYLRPDTASLDLVCALEKLAPFGMGFREPVFGMTGLKLVESRAVGQDGAHWKVRFRPPDGAPVLNAIWFGHGFLTASCPVGVSVDAAFHLKRSFFQEQWRLDVQVQDLRVL